jgi:hypothetical protein
MNQEEYISENIIPLKDGIYMVQTILNGTHVKFLHERLEDLPKAMVLASFEPYRKKISDSFLELITKTDNPVSILNTKSLMKVVDTVMKGEVTC